VTACCACYSSSARRTGLLCAHTVSCCAWRVAGFSHEHDTWEPLENLNCPEILKQWEIDKEAKKSIEAQFAEARKRRRRCVLETWCVGPGLVGLRRVFVQSEDWSIWFARVGSVGGRI